MTKSICLSFTMSIFFLLSAFGSASASGTYSGSHSNSNRNSDLNRQVDQTYEIGKAVYSGRQQGVDKIAYCVKVDDELLPVKRKSLKSFKRGSYDDLAQSLFNCDQPEVLVGEQLSRDNLIYVLYYAKFDP